MLLVIIVSLVIGATQAFGKMNDFMNRFIGEYVVCLMEYGELPSLGTTDANLKKHLGSGGGSGRKCDQEFSGFTFESGRPPTGSGSGGSGSSASSGKNNNSGSKNSSGNASKDGSGKGGGKNASDSASNSDGSDRNGGSGRKAAPYAKGKVIRASSNNYGTGDAGGGDQKIKVIDEDEGGGRGRKKDSDNYSRTSRIGNGRDRYRAITGTMAQEIEKRQPKKADPVRRSVRALAGDEGNRFTPYKKTLQPREIAAKEMKEDDNSSFGFGYIIRWLMIAGMVLAIIVFFGGQVMNYSNSKD
ncbi:MAG: hypothetical protein ABL930_08590 [Pseudobdellovibrio sp.]